MKPQLGNDSAPASDALLLQTVSQLARDASIEINVQDVKHLGESQALLPAGTRIFVTHLPKQTWQETAAGCAAVREAGFEPVAHVPVRLIPDVATLDEILAALVGRAGVKQILLIAGDYSQVAGPYAATSDVLRSGLLSRHGLKRIAMAGHPEGHPKVALDEIRRAEREKVMLAAELGLEVTLVSQFVFECAPFLHWIGALRSNHIRAHVVAGLAGPANVATLFKFAMRCGAGPSIRALGTRPTSVMKLIGDHGPEVVMRGLAQARSAGESDFAGVHLFCFGGFLRTCKWLHAVADGRFELQGGGGLKVNA